MILTAYDNDKLSMIYVGIPQRSTAVIEEDVSKSTYAGF